MRHKHVFGLVLINCFILTGFLALKSTSEGQVHRPAIITLTWDELCQGTPYSLHLSKALFYEVLLDFKRWNGNLSSCRFVSILRACGPRSITFFIFITTDIRCWFKQEVVRWYARILLDWCIKDLTWSIGLWGDLHHEVELCNTLRAWSCHFLPKQIINFITVSFIYQ